MLDGDNSYKCERCNKKVAALKRVCLKKLPNHLIMVLKRFEFDLDTMQKAKINDSCEFPFNLNLEEYTQQGLRKKEQKEKTQMEQEKENVVPDQQEELPPEYFQYKLSGVVIHMGTADR